jgi:hypothetical protein
MILIWRMLKKDIYLEDGEKIMKFAAEHEIIIWRMAEKDGWKM